MNQLIKTPVVIRVYVSGKIAKTLSMGIKILPDHWDQVARCVLRGETNYVLYNMKIKKEVSRLEAMYTQNSILGIIITQARAKQIAEGKEPVGTFLNFVTSGSIKNIQIKKLLELMTVNLPS